LNTASQIEDSDPATGHLFAGRARRAKRNLFLPRFLKEAGENQQLRGPGLDQAIEIIERWASMDHQGHLTKHKETALDHDDAEYVLSTFTSTGRHDTDETGRYTTADRVLEAYERFRWKMS
jgi:hypothetical protein